MEKTNFKKWGWWAIGGVVAIAVIVGAVAMMGSGPEPADTEDPEGDGTTNVVDVTPDDTKKPQDEVTNPEELPKSGPVEESMLALLLAGVFAYIMGLSLTSVYRAAKREK